MAGICRSSHVVSGAISNQPVCDFLRNGNRTVSGAKCLPFAEKVFCNGYAGAVLLFPGRLVCDFLCDYHYAVSGAMTRPSVIFFTDAIPLFPGLGACLSLKRFSVMDTLEQFYCFRGGPSAIFSGIATVLFPGRRVVRRRYLLATETETVLLSWTSDSLDVSNWRPSEDSF